MPNDPKPLLKLYITGRSQRSERAISRAKKLSENYGCEVEIIDVLENRGVAEQENIIATPTLIKTYPPPVRRFIGDLTNLKTVRQALDLPKRRPDATRTSAEPAPEQ